MNHRPDAALLAHYDQRLEAYGDSARGADWPNEEDRRKRFDVMLDLIADPERGPLVLCDLGCGTGQLLAHMRRRGLQHIRYIGADRSAKALALARSNFPDAEFVEIDINEPGAALHLLSCDYLVANGLFTVRAGLTEAQMWEFLDSSLRAVWPQVRKGLAFNVMSKVVDWEREDLFHASADELLRKLHALAGRRVRLRADYGLYEYTAYAFKAESVEADASPQPDAVAGANAVVPVMRPRLPSAQRLFPYLQRIDSSRVYSNLGPLATELEGRLAASFGLEDGTVASASSGLSALVGAILGSAGRADARRPIAVMPSFTFVATAVAAEQCGFQPWLADVDASDWLMSPELALQHPALDQVGLVIPVAAMGRPVEQAPWREFSARTGIPVVIDGAAEFDAIVGQPSRFVGPVPVALSFHATKSFGVGEGGAVVSSDTALLSRAMQALNFGFYGTRDSASASTNGKMSEYHAAVGLAELDGWDDKQAEMRSVAERYRQAFGVLGLSSQLHVAPEVSGSYVLFLAVDEAQADRVVAAMAADRLDCRLWYGLGLHRQSYFASLPRGSLQATNALAPRLLGLPNAPDLSDNLIERVARAVAEGVRGEPSPTRAPE